MNRADRICLSVVVMVLMAWAWKGAEASEREIVAALQSEPVTLNPQQRADDAEALITDNIFETLYRRTASGAFRPLLAAALPDPVSPNSWRIALRPNVRFHNGEPFNADSVVFSVRRMQDPRFGSVYQPLFQPISGAKRLDDLTVEIETEAPDPDLLARLAWLKIVPPRFAQFPKFDDAPAGTGPYRIAEWRKGDAVRLTSFADYRDGAPSITGVTCRFVPDPGERIAGLAAGEVDLVPNLLPEFAEKAPRLIRAPGLDQPLILLNTSAGLTRDVRVRQALNLAVDKDTIAKMVFLEHAKPSAGQVPIPGMAGFNPEIDAYPYEPERAWSLVLEAGAEGMPIELVGSSGGWPKDKDLLEVVAAYWEAAGLQPRIRALEPDAYAAFRAENALRPDGLMARVPNYLGEAGPLYAALFREEDTASANPDRELTELIAAARMESSEQRRNALYQQAARRAHENAYCVWLVVPDRLYGAARRIQWSPPADGGLRFSDMQVSE